MRLYDPGTDPSEPVQAPRSYADVLEALRLRGQARIEDLARDLSETVALVRHHLEAAEARCEVRQPATGLYAFGGWRPIVPAVNRNPAPPAAQPRADPLPRLGDGSTLRQEPEKEPPPPIKEHRPPERGDKAKWLAAMMAQREMEADHA